MVTSQYFLERPPCLRSHDCEVQNESHLDRDKVRCRYGIGRVVTSDRILSHRFDLTLSQMTIFRLFQTEFADNNFKVDENGRKFAKQLGNTCDEQFPLFPQCFQKTYTADM